MKPVLAVLGKDLRLELRTLETVPAMALFSLTTFVIFHFALNRSSLDGQLAAGVLIATLLFAGMLAVNRLFVAEREQGGALAGERDEFRVAGDVDPAEHAGQPPVGDAGADRIAREAERQQLLSGDRGVLSTQ